MTTRKIHVKVLRESQLKLIDEICSSDEEMFDKSPFVFSMFITYKTEDEVRNVSNEQSIEVAKKLHDYGFKTIVNVEVERIPDSFELIKKIVNYSDVINIKMKSKKYLTPCIGEFIESVKRLNNKTIVNYV